MIPDDVGFVPDARKLVEGCEPVHLSDTGLGRFVRISAGRLFDSGPLIYMHLDFPMGPEDAVTRAFEEEAPSLDGIKGVIPALEAAFRVEVWQRNEDRRRRAEAEARRRAEEERRRRDELRREVLEKHGDGAGRRELARMDFAEAARAALAVGGATLLDHRPSPARNEMVVRFRLGHRRFECTCDARTLQIIEAGICLTAHGDDEFEAGVRGDRFFTLESLPSVIAEAEREGKLVVFRHLE
jgi:hypothetical protein